MSVSLPAIFVSQDEAFRTDNDKLLHFPSGLPSLQMTEKTRSGDPYALALLVECCGSLNQATLQFR
jgi:hypothetical protein